MVWKQTEKRGALLSLGLLVFSIFMFITLTFVIFIALFQGRSRATLVLSSGVGIVEVEGVILNPTTILEQLEEYRAARGIEAVVLKINTPGGSVGAVQEIYDKVLEVKTEKPVVAALGAIAASGGYYVATAANKIISNPGAITGSIGVIMKFADAGKLLEWMKVRPYNIKSGKYKDIGSPDRMMTEEERRLLQGVIRDSHEQFVEAVIEGRGLDRDDVAEIADGRIFTGRQAQKIGLVDKLGSLREAIKLAAEVAGIKGEPKVVYPPKKQKRSLIERSSVRLRNLSISTLLSLHSTF
ncbi:MAG: signal peptide peptidase SppA [Deltaproteobacteria bacterium]|nr:signal peptide peptidase SppA [Deltaproteobacteria bacterium]